MKRGKLSTELTAFVPPDEPAGFYLLTIRNDSDAPKQIRFAPYFRIALADHPENSGPLEIKTDVANATIYFTNPRNTFRSGPAFAAISMRPEKIETRRGRFLGPGRSPAHPAMVETGEPWVGPTDDAAAIASFLVAHDLGHARPERHARTGGGGGAALPDGGGRASEAGRHPCLVA